MRQNVDMLTRSQVHCVSDAIRDAWNAHRVDLLAAHYSNDAEYIDAGSGIVTSGLDALKVSWEHRLTAFPDFRLERTALAIDGDLCAASWILNGTQTGEYDELPPSGRSVEITGTSFTELADTGLVVRDTVLINTAGLLHQLGLD